MLEDLKAELVSHIHTLQDAALESMAKLDNAAKPKLYGREAWSIKRLQRDPFLFGLRSTLFDGFGSFRFNNSLYPRNRFVLHSDEHNADLVFRRRGSISAYSSVRERQAPLMLYPNLERVYELAEGASYQVAAIWDLPLLDADHQPLGPVPLVARIAKPGTSISENLWTDDAPVPLYPTTWKNNPLPRHPRYNPDADDWGTDANEDAE